MNKSEFVENESETRNLKIHGISKGFTENWDGEPTKFRLRYSLDFGGYDSSLILVNCVYGERNMRRHVDPYPLDSYPDTYHSRYSEKFKQALPSIFSEVKADIRVVCKDELGAVDADPRFKEYFGKHIDTCLNYLLKRTRRLNFEEKQK